MPRFARVVVPQIPHHVVQRGNRRQRTFFSDEDFYTYVRLMGEACREFGVEIWGYCLMPNHVHLIAVPGTERALAAAVGRAHEAYTRYFNFRNGWRGYLWQGRFSSYPMDDAHLLLCARYIELNPVSAALVGRVEDYVWSSAGAHLGTRSEGFVNPRPLLERVGDWRGFLEEGLEREKLRLLERHERTGRPLGSDEFIEQLERLTGRTLKCRKPGPKPGTGSA